MAHQLNASQHDGNEGDNERLGHGEDEDMDLPGIDENFNAQGGAGYAAVLPELDVALKFIDGIKNATLEESALDAASIHRLSNPIQQEVPVQSTDVLFSLETFLNLQNASQAAYTSIASSAS